MALQNRGLGYPKAGTMTSKSDQRRYDALHRYGCVACRIDGRFSQGDIHHLVDKGTRKLSGGNKSTILLCLWHHRGRPPEGYQIEKATESFGPSLKHQSKAFRERYGSQRELLDKVNSEMGLLAIKERK
jgi:hypothetical protein